MNDIKENLASDAFAIKPDALVMLCRTMASRQQREASLFCQPCDCTAESLFMLYHKQRGRCQVTGLPMTYSSGSKSPYNIEIDHRVKVIRHTSMRLVAEGGQTKGGMAGMMENIQLVTRIGHFIRHRFDDSGADYMLVSSHMHGVCLWGPPNNDNVTAVPESESDTREAIAKCISDYLSGCKFPPFTKQIVDFVKQLFPCATDNSIRSIAASVGYNSRSSNARARVAAACEFLKQNDYYMRSVGLKRIPEEAKEGLLTKLASLGCPQVSAATVKGDMTVAYELITGEKVISSYSLGGLSWIRKKLSTWSKSTPSTRSKVMSFVKRGEWGWIPIESVIDCVISSDQVALCDDSGVYVEQARAGLRSIVNDMHFRRMIDISGDRLRPRMLADDAARECGLSKNYLKKLHKIGIGPPCEVSSWGAGRVLSFSPEEVVSWRNNRVGISSACESSGFS